MFIFFIKRLSMARKIIYVYKGRYDGLFVDQKATCKVNIFYIR